MFFENMFKPSLAFFPFILGLVILDVVLKGLSLWKSARNGQKFWFIALLIVNSAGILPGIYLLFFQRNKKAK
jgi:hypothetical protein